MMSRTHVTLKSSAGRRELSGIVKKECQMSMSGMQGMMQLKALLITNHQLPVDKSLPL